MSHALFLVAGKPGPVVCLHILSAGQPRASTRIARAGLFRCDLLTNSASASGGFGRQLAMNN